MAANIKLKRSAVQSRVPTTTDLELGELGLNTYDGKVYMKKDDGTAAIVEVGGAVDSVNTLTGAVSLGIEDLDDFTLASADSIPYDTWSADNTPSAGEWHINSSFFYLPKVDSNGSDQSSNLEALDGTTSLTISQGGTDYVITNATLFSSELGSANQRAFITSGSSAGGVIATINSAITKSGGITIACSSFSTSLLPLANGDILQYVSADSKFKPAQLPTAVSSIDDLSDVDTSTVAPTDGQVLAWDNTASKWEPADGGGAGALTDDSSDDSVYPATATRDLKIGGTLPSAPNITLSSSGSATFAGTGYLAMPSGTTAQRVTAANGHQRYNSDLGAMEIYVQGQWQPIKTDLDYGLITAASTTTIDYGALS